MGGAVWTSSTHEDSESCCRLTLLAEGLAGCRQLVGTRMCLKATAYNKAETMLLHFNALV